MTSSLRDRRASLRATVTTYYDPAAAKARRELMYLVQIVDLDSVGMVLDAVAQELDRLHGKAAGSLDTGQRLAVIARRVRQEREYLASRLDEPPATPYNAAQISEAREIDAAPAPQEAGQRVAVLDAIVGALRERGGPLTERQLVEALAASGRRVDLYSDVRPAMWRGRDRGQLRFPDGDVETVELVTDEARTAPGGDPR